MTLSEDTIDNLVKHLWSLEGMGIREEDNSDVMLRFYESIWFNEVTSRYQVSLPWRSGIMSSLIDQLRRFQGNPKLFDQYNSVMMEQIERGVIEMVPAEPPSVGEANYIPHHAVVREDHSTTKL